MIAVLGAGSVGCWVGGTLAHGGANVTLIGRPTMRSDLANGFVVSDLDGSDFNIPPNRFRFSTDPSPLSEADLVLLTVKGPDTRAAAEVIARLAPANAKVVSLQNGIGPAELLQDTLGEERVVPAAVVFNVVRPTPTHFLRATDGNLILPEESGLDARLIDLPLEISSHIEHTRWGKLMLNLNNALNVLSGVPLRDHLLDREWRKVFAMCIAEGRSVARAKGITPARIGKVHPTMAQFVLPLPNGLFTRLASAMMKIDPNARTSMVDDLEQGRQPELDTLNGAIVREGRRCNVPTPVNEAVVEAVRAAFASSASPKLTGSAFRERYRV